MDTLPHTLLVDVWFWILALMAACYVVSDGFDLGIGILSLFAPDRPTREVMIDTIVHMRDANETWLVVIGGGLFGAFPAAYALLLPQLYVPVITLILGLIARGAAIELRGSARDAAGLPATTELSTKARRPHQRWSLATWDRILGLGSLLVAVSQGVLVGRLLTGMRPGAWHSTLVLAAILGVCAGYALLGSTYLIGRGVASIEHRRWTPCALVLALGSAVLLAGDMLWHQRDELKTLPWASIALGLIAAALALYLVRLVVVLRHPARSSHERARRAPFGVAVALFLVSLAGLASSVFPYVVPGRLTLAEAASDDRVLALMLIGVGVLLPIMVGYALYQNHALRTARGDRRARRRLF